MTLLSTLILLAACAKPVATVAPAQPAPPPPPDPALGPVPAMIAPTPDILYGQCRERLEGPEADGECASDADCARAGCSSEACVAASRVPEVVTTCEVLPCFSVLDACGCREGRCAWSLKEAQVPPLPRIPRPVPPQPEAGT